MRRKPRVRRLLKRVTGLVRAQVEKEEQARLIDSLATLDQASQRPARGVMAPQPPRQAAGAAVDDPLERWWALPASCGDA